jgi:hypothetical protein
MLATSNVQDVTVALSQSTSLRHSLISTRLRCVVGREEEKALFCRALRSEDPAIFHIHGPGGVGKTTLLHEFISLCPNALYLDARDLELSPEGFLRALAGSLELGSYVSPLEFLSTRQERTVLLLDTYELLTSLDGWLREGFLPQLPSNSIVVLAGRQPPTPGWRCDPAWRSVMRVIGLRNLSPDDCCEYLKRRRIAETPNEAVRFTHGHPLALSLVADVLEQSSETFELITSPDIVKTLLESFIQAVPSSAHREALEICAHTRVTSEALLREALSEGDAHTLFAWLRTLSFIQQGSEGLFPHDLARDVIDADLRWRDPDGYAALHQRVRVHITRRIQELRGLDQFRASSDKMYLHRNSPIMKRFFNFEEVGRIRPEKARAEDHATIIAMTEKHEGQVSARIVAHWLRRQSQAFRVVRGRTELLGFFAHLALHEVSEEDLDADPVVKAALEYVARHAPLRAGEAALCNRFMIDKESYHDPSPVINAFQTAHNCDWYATPRLAWAMIHTSPLWEPILNYIDFQRVSLDVQTNTMPQVSLVHDWRVRPLEPWFKMMCERAITTDMSEEDLPTEPPATPLLVLSRPAFEEAVKQALRDYHDPQALAKNPLLHSRLIIEAGGHEASENVLRRLLEQAVKSLTIKPKDKKFYCALNATYIEPAMTRELAAERLSLPFGTYRYHLTTGLERVIEHLWRLELQTH